MVYTILPVVYAASQTEEVNELSFFKHKWQTTGVPLEGLELVSPPSTFA